MKMNPTHYRYASVRDQNRPDTANAYRDFDATELYCPQCKRAVAVRKRLLLVLPEGDKYEYLCRFCSATIGTKMDRQTKPVSLII
jgi:hypothetical protein